MSMTDDELRIEIALQKGYHWFSYGGSSHAILCRPDYFGLVKGSVEIPKPESDMSILLKCPDYTHDIATCYKLEAEIMAEGDLAMSKYATILYDIICHANPVLFSFYFALAHATPRQRAEAWWMMMTEKEGRGEG